MYKVHNHENYYSHDIDEHRVSQKKVCFRT